MLEPEVPLELLLPDSGGMVLLGGLSGGVVAEPDIEPDAEPLALPSGADGGMLPGGTALPPGVPVAPVEPLLLYESLPDVRGCSVLSPQAVRPPKASTAVAAIKVLFISISFADVNPFAITTTLLAALRWSDAAGRSLRHP